MSIHSRLNRMQQQTADEKLRAGLTTHAPTLASFTLASQKVQTADVIAVLQSRSNASKAVESARAAWLAAVAEERNEQGKSKTLVSGIKQSLHLMFAGSADTLAEFGLTPRKARVVSPDVKVAAATKAKATRKARHTQGKVQKAQVKGALDGVKLVVSAQPESASTPAPVAAPAQHPAQS